MTDTTGKYLTFEVISGVDGPCLSVVTGPRSGFRLDGPKPWGGGSVKHTFTVSVDELMREAMPDHAIVPKADAELAAAARDLIARVDDAVMDMGAVVTREEVKEPQDRDWLEVGVAMAEVVNLHTAMKAMRRRIDAALEDER